MGQGFKKSRTPPQAGPTNIIISFSGTLREVVYKSPTQGYAILQSDGIFMFDDAKPDLVDLFMVGSGQDGTTTGPGGNGGRVSKYIDVVPDEIFSVVVPGAGTNQANTSVNIGSGYNTNSGDYAVPGTTNPILDFWGRLWASPGGNAVASSAGDGSSYGGLSGDSGGGGSVIAGGGGGRLYNTIQGQGGSPGGGNAGSAGSNGGGSGAGHTTGYNGGGAAGNGTETAAQVGGGGGLGGGGGGGGAAGSKTAPSAAQGGGGIVIIRWGDSPL